MQAQQYIAFNDKLITMFDDQNEIAEHQQIQQLEAKQHVTQTKSRSTNELEDTNKIHKHILSYLKHTKQDHLVDNPEIMSELRVQFAE